MRTVEVSVRSLGAILCAGSLFALALFGGVLPAHSEENSEQEDAVPKYTLTLENKDMVMIVERLRRKYELRVCFELAPKDPEKDHITLESEVKRLQGLAEERQLSSSEQHKLEKLLWIVEQGSPPDTGVGWVRHRYSGTFAGETPAEVLDALCADGPYGWFEENGTYVILPRTGSRFDYPVTLDVENMPILDVFEEIAKQDPDGGLRIGGLMHFQTRPGGLTYSEILGKCLVPRLVLEGVPALEAMCRAAEGAGGQLAWTGIALPGSSAGRISLHPLPALKKLWYPSTGD